MAAAAFRSGTSRDYASSGRTGRTKALADAAAGVVGSLVSVLTFYPVDVWKTSVQADAAVPKSLLQTRGLSMKVAHTVVSVRQ